MQLRFAFGLRASILGLAMVALVLLFAKGRVDRVVALEAESRARAELEVRLDLVRQRAGSAGSMSDPRAWDALADELGGLSRARVTFIDARGKIVGDSAVPLEGLASFEAHEPRPEVEQALRGQSAEAERISQETGLRMHYAARPLVSEGAVQGVVRLGLDEDALALPRLPLTSPLWLAFGFGAVVALLLGVTVSSLLAARVRQLTSVALRLAEGDLAARARQSEASELDPLARGLNHLGANFSRTLNALHEERDRMRCILSNMDEGVLFLDEDGRIALVNPKLREMLLLEGDLTGRSVLEVIRHADLKELLDAAFDEDEEGNSVQGDIHIAGLKPRHLLVRARRLDGPELGLVAVFIDVTEMRRLENLRREFVANVSHELRTPVTTIRSAAETLETLPPGEEASVAQFVGIISRNAHRLQALVEDLLDLSRIDSRQYSLTLEAMHPREVIDLVFRLHAERAHARQIRLLVDVPTDFPKLRVDRKALEHILSNLVDNAVKYTGTGKTITVRAVADSDSGRLDVADDGAGIDARHLPRLFERFYRVDPGRSREVGGTGLGLSIVKNLAESMSGRVSVDSTMGQGTVFSVRLPYASARGTLRPPRVSEV
jgi:two-component system, OmpR family, phosphate regulon sensor histidine kinase PhoR